MSTEVAQRRTLQEELALPEGVTVVVEEDGFTIKGKKGEVRRRIEDPGLSISVEGQKIVFSIKGKKRAKTALMTTVAHAKNILRGVMEGHTYKLKICSGHFPMNVAISGNELVIKNFLGEKFPRKIAIESGASVKVQGTEVVVESVDKEVAGRTAGAIEQLTRISNRDRRVFQDGIYLVMKDGKELK